MPLTTEAEESVVSAAPSEKRLGIEPASLERAARIFRAAGDTSRLRLLSTLMLGERSVSDLAELVGAHVPAVSHQLRILRSEDLVTTRRDGKRIYYSLADDHILQLVETALAHAVEVR